MPIRRSREDGLEDYAFDPKFHAKGTHGSKGRCTHGSCLNPPTVSRHWQNPSYPNGWWGAYCDNHLRPLANEA